MSGEMQVDPAAQLAAASRLASSASRNGGMAQMGAMQANEDFGDDQIGAAFAKNYPGCEQIFENKQTLTESCRAMADRLRNFASLVQRVDGDSADGVERATAGMTGGASGTASGVWSSDAGRLRNFSNLVQRVDGDSADAGVPPEPATASGGWGADAGVPPEPGTASGGWSSDTHVPTASGGWGASEAPTATEAFQEWVRGYGLYPPASAWEVTFGTEQDR